MRIVAAVVLVLGVVARALGATDPNEYQCPAVKKNRSDSGRVVVAATPFNLSLRVALRYELASPDRVCKRGSGAQEERFRSYPVKGTARPRGPARTRILLALEELPIDIDTSTAISVLLPETPGLQAYACFRLLSSSPAARLCLPSDLDGNVTPDGKSLFCNRGRCRPRNINFVFVANDLYEGASDAEVTLPEVSSPVAGIAITKRGKKLGRLDMEVALGVRDVLSLRVKLRGSGHIGLEGDRQTGAEPPQPVKGRGRRTEKIGDLGIVAELESPQGPITITTRRSDADRSPENTPARFSGCYLLTVDDGAATSTIRLPLELSTNGLGATRPTVEIPGNGSAPVSLDAGDCGVTTSGRLACTVPSGSDAIQLLGVVELGPVSGQGTLAVGVNGRVASWTATACPAP